MPRATSPTPLTRAICAGARDIYDQYGSVLRGTHGTPEMPDVPEDDAGLMTVQRLFEKYRGEGLLPEFSNPPTHSEIQHTASIWLWRERYGIERRAVETLPLWLRVNGYPVLDVVVVACMIKSLYREIPEEIQSGSQKDKLLWVMDLVEDARMAEAKRKRPDPMRTRLVRRLSDEFFATEWQQRDSALLIEDDTPEGLAVQRGQHRSLVRNQAVDEAGDVLNAALSQRYMRLAGGAVDSVELQTLLASIATERPAVRGRNQLTEVLPIDPHRTVNGDLTIATELEVAMVSYSTLIEMLRSDPPIVQILNDTLRSYDAYIQNDRVNPELPSISLPSQDSALLRQCFIDACSAVCLNSESPGNAAN